MEEKIKAVKEVWKVFSRMSGDARLILSASLAVTIPAVSVAWFLWTHDTKDNGEFESRVITQIDGLHRQVTAVHLTSQRSWERQFAFNDSIGNRVRDVIDGQRDLTLITAADSPAEVLKILAPYLTGIRDDTYKTVLWIQRQEVLSRFPKQHSIELHKKGKDE